MQHCRCGCGVELPVGRSRFVPGHGGFHKPLRPGGYKEHGSTMAHRLRAERALGKPLPKGAVVHHADGSKDERAPLVICHDRAYHNLLHARMRVVRAGGNPNTDRWCSTCQRMKNAALFNPSTIGRCRDCERARNDRRRRLGAIPKGRLRSDCGLLEAEYGR